MTEVTVHAAKTNLSKLIERARAGEEIVIRRGTEPVARLVAIHPAGTGRRFGSLKGLIQVDDSFFDSLPDEELDLWEGGGK